MKLTLADLSFWSVALGSAGLLITTLWIMVDITELCDIYVHNLLSPEQRRVTKDETIERVHSAIMGVHYFTLSWFFLGMGLILFGIYNDGQNNLVNPFTLLGGAICVASLLAMKKVRQVKKPVNKIRKSFKRWEHEVNETIVNQTYRHKH